MRAFPNELKALVASFVEDHTTLINLALTNKTFYGLIKRREARLSHDLCCRKFGHDLPFLLAVFESRKLLSARAFLGQPQPLSDVTVEDIIKFVDQYFTDPTFADSQFSINVCIQLSSFDGIVDKYAAITARLALENTPGGSMGSVNITQSEATRFRKAFYIAELLRNLFSRDHISQPAAAAQRESAFRPAWQHLLAKFAPWELQQVRCAKDLLAQHVQNVMSSDAARRGQGSPTTDRRLLRAFVSNEGLTALSRLEGLGEHCATQSAIVQFHGRAQNWTRTDLWYGVHDTMWLQPMGQLTSFDTTDIIDQYPEPDSGPRDAWLHTLLQTHADMAMFHAGARLCFKCDHHATQWGYALWDRERLNHIAQGGLPTTQQMVDVGIGMVGLETDEMMFYSKFRKEKGCTCRQKYTS